MKVTFRGLEGGGTPGHLHFLGGFFHFASPGPNPYPPGMAKKTPAESTAAEAPAPTRARPSSLVDTRVIYCGDNLEQLKKLPDACVDLIYIDPPFNSNRNYEGPSRTGHRWGETKEKRAFEDRQFLQPRRLARLPLREGHAR